MSPKVVKFYKALAREEAHLVRQPHLVVEPEDEIVEPTRKYTLSTTENPFEKCPEKVFSEKKLSPVICYHCSKEGHPAWACRLEKVLRINS